jgi:solute:Na+ symporter, SSS family
VVKDTLILAIVLFLGIYLPIHYYGGYNAMFTAIQAAKPDFLALPAKGESIAWFDSTVLLTALGFYMWPHSFGSLFTAKEERAFRRNAVMMPLYQLILLFVFFVGFAAILKVPGLKGPDIDLSLLRLSVQSFDPWFVGVIGAAGVLTALVPGSMILISAATLLANNIFRIARPQTTDATVSRLARLLVPVVALVSVFFTLDGGTTIVALLLMGYSFVTQLFPPLIASLLPRNPVTREGAFAGICVGVATVAVTSLTHTSVATLFPALPETLRDLNIGVVALILNLIALSAVSAMTRRRTAYA